VQDVQAKVARVRRQLPPNTEEPVIQRFDPLDSPIVTIVWQSTSARCARSPTWPTR